MTLLIINVIFCITLTISCYFLSLKLYRKYKKGWLNPLYTASILLVFCCLFSISMKRPTGRLTTSLINYYSLLLFR